MIEIDRDNCTSCGFCVRTLPDVFGFDEYGWAFVKTSINANIKTEKIIEVANKCPSSCIRIRG